MTAIRYRTKPDLGCPFCMSNLCKTVFASGASVLVKELSLHIRMFVFPLVWALFSLRVQHRHAKIRSLLPLRILED